MVAIYYDAADKPSGYMVYLIKDDIMYIKEMIYLTREAQRGPVGVHPRPRFHDRRGARQLLLQRSHRL